MGIGYGSLIGVVGWGMPLVGGAIGAVHGLAIAAAVGGLEIFGTRTPPGRLLERAPLGLAVAVKGLMYTAVIVLVEVGRLGEQVLGAGWRVSPGRRVLPPPVGRVLTGRHGRVHLRARGGPHRRRPHAARHRTRSIPPAPRRGAPVPVRRHRGLDRDRRAPRAAGHAPLPRPRLRGGRGSGGGPRGRDLPVRGRRDRRHLARPRRAGRRPPPGLPLRARGRARRRGRAASSASSGWYRACARLCTAAPW